MTLKAVQLAFGQEEEIITCHGQSLTDISVGRYYQPILACHRHIGMDPISL